jgi:hypothetical protein
MWDAVSTEWYLAHRNNCTPVCQVRRLAAVLLTMRLAVLPAEAAAPLKLLEKGVSKEALAGLVRPARLDSFLAAGDRPLASCCRRASATRHWRDW